MKLAVISDIHENYHNLIEFLKVADKQKFSHIVFLGDFMNGGIARVLARCGYPVYAIWGNNDGDLQAVLHEALHPESGMTMAKHQYGFFTTADGRKLFLTHHPDLVSTAVDSGRYDAVFFAHTHNSYLTVKDDVLVLNPGELSAHKFGKAGYAVYDTQTNSAQLFTIEETVTVKTKQVAQAYERLGFNSHDEYNELLS